MVGGQFIRHTPRFLKSHMGIFMTIGKGCMCTSSCKQKLNTKSSTEAELVAIDDAMGQILRSRHFSAAQGELVLVTTIYQDNKSTKYLSENGRASSSEHTMHLDVSLFFCDGPNRSRGSQSSILSYRKYAGRFLHQVTSRGLIPTHEKPHT